MALPPEFLEVRCAGCGETLEVEPGLTEFACPDCGTQQALPPELMPPPPRRPRRALPIPGRGASVSAIAAAPARLPCGGCGALLSVPPGLGRFGCPLCGIELTVDGARLRLFLASSAATVSVVAPPTAVTLTSPFPRRRPEVQEEFTSRAIRVVQVQAERYDKPIHSEEAQGQYHDRSVCREESFNSFRANTRTAIYKGLAHKEPRDRSVHGEESRVESLDETVVRSSRRETRISVDPESVGVEKEQAQPPIQVSHVSQAQGGHPNCAVRADRAQWQHSIEATTSHGKHKTGRAAVSSIMEQEQAERPTLNQAVHAEKVQVESPSKTTGWNLKRKRSSKATGGNHKRKKKGLVSSSNQGLHVRRSKRLAKEPEHLINTEPIQQPAASPTHIRSDPPDIDRIIATLCPSPSRPHQLSEASSSGSGHDDATTAPASANNHGTSQAEQFPHCYSQLYPPEVRGTKQLDKSGTQEQPNPRQAIYQVMHGRWAQEPSGNATSSEQELVESPSKTIVGYKNKMKGLMSSMNEGNHLGNWSSGTHRMMPVTACSRLATESSPLTATPLPTTTLPSVITIPPVHDNIPPSPQRQPSNTPHSEEDAQGGCVLSGSVGRSSEKHRGRRPTRLIEPRRESDRPVLIPNNIDNWDINPPCPKAASTITVLMKQRYPGSTYLPASQHADEGPDGEVVHHWHQYPPDTRATILKEFLQRYKWAPGREGECMKLFDRRAVRQFAGLLCEEKRRARVELAVAQRAKKALNAHRSNRQMEDAREELEDQQVVETDKDDDPLQWKLFPPAWMYLKWWERLCEHWAKEEVLKMSSQNRKNRYTGGRAHHTTGSRSIAMHRQLMIMENGGKPVSDIDVFNKTHKRDGGTGEFISERAKRTMEGFTQRMEEAGDTLLDPHLAWAQEVGGRNRGRYYGLPGILNKARIDELAKSVPDCFGKRTQRQKFTQEQVQQMINQALQGLNETWEKKFQSLEQSLCSVPLLGVVPEHAPRSSVGGAQAHENQWSPQDASGSVHREKCQSADEDEDMVSN